MLSFFLIVDNVLLFVVLVDAGKGGLNHVLLVFAVVVDSIKFLIDDVCVVVSFKLNFLPVSSTFDCLLELSNDCDLNKL